MREKFSVGQSHGIGQPTSVRDRRNDVLHRDQPEVASVRPVDLLGPVSAVGATDRRAPSGIAGMKREHRAVEDQVREFYDSEGWVVRSGVSGEDRFFRSPNGGHGGFGELVTG